MKGNYFKSPKTALSRNVQQIDCFSDLTSQGGNEDVQSPDYDTSYMDSANTSMQSLNSTIVSR
jgi:hypothetical protein